MTDAATLDALNLTPNVTVNDMAESLRFYVDGLGFGEEMRHEEDGRLVYVHLKGGGAEIGLVQDDFAKGNDRKKGVGQRIWIGVKDDLDGIAERVKAAGFALDSEPEALPWGGRAFNVTDPDGFAISVAMGD